MTSPILLTGLDGENPLGFLAALGLLDVATRRGHDARLGWTLAGRWRPSITGVADLDALVAEVLADHCCGAFGSAFAYAYPNPKKAGEPVRDLKAPPEHWRAHLEALLAVAGPQTRTEVDRAEAFAPEGGLDNNGATKPTALHFTAGQQRFLEMVVMLHEGLDESHVREALVGPWAYESPLPCLGWDVTNDRAYALRAINPSSGKKRGIPGAEWLALLGLSFLPTFVRHGTTLTTAVHGAWKSGRLTWCVWQPLIPAPVVRSLVGAPLTQMTSEEREGWGIATVLSARIRRHDQGGYGSFAPPSALP